MIGGLTAFPVVYLLISETAGTVVGIVTVVVFAAWVVVALSLGALFVLAWVGTWLGVLFGIAERKREE